MNTDRDLIVSLGGIRAVARKLGHTNHTTVQGWADRNRIPLARKDEVVSLAISQLSRAPSDAARAA